MQKNFEAVLAILKTSSRTLDFGKYAMHINMVFSMAANVRDDEQRNAMYMDLHDVVHNTPADLKKWLVDEQIYPPCER